MNTQQQRSLHGSRDRKKSTKVVLGNLMLGGFLLSFFLIVALNYKFMNNTETSIITKSSMDDYPKKNGRILLDNILRSTEKYGADEVWEDIIHKGDTIMKNNGYKEHLTVVEVGAQNAVQTLLAAR